MKDCVKFSQGALGHDYVAKVDQHSSQTDAAKGFGGKYGVQKDRIDKVRNVFCALKTHHFVISEMCWLLYSVSFILSFFIQSAMNYEYKGEVQQHASQKGNYTLKHLAVDQRPQIQSMCLLKYF